MLVYQFMSAAHALDNLRKRRLKVSFLTDMNDPFELLGVIPKGLEHREGFRKFREHMNGIAYVLCFSKSWGNPVLWSHYAEKHRGLCLGFEVPQQHLLPMSYEVERLELDVEQILMDGSEGDEFRRRILTTKFAHWAYEDEVRMLVKLNETHEELGLHFYPFGQDLALRKIVLGVRSALAQPVVEAAVQKQDAPAEVITTRLAFKSFRVIQDIAEE